MKNIKKLCSRGLFLGMISGGASLGFSMSLHAEAVNADIVHISLVDSVDLADSDNKQDHKLRSLRDYISLNETALNEITSKVALDLKPVTLYSYASDVDQSKSITGPETITTNGAAVGVAVKSDSQVRAQIDSTSEESPSLEEVIRGDADKSSDKGISEPLLTSILALIAIVAVARRNVSGS